MPLQKQNITEHNRYNIDKKETKKGKKEKKKKKMKWNTKWNEIWYQLNTTIKYNKEQKKIGTLQSAIHSSAFKFYYWQSRVT